LESSGAGSDEWEAKPDRIAPLEIPAGPNELSLCEPGGGELLRTIRGFVVVSSGDGFVTSVTSGKLVSHSVLPSTCT
jgi:hypothetical protein